jgi:hypothetical protein
MLRIAIICLLASCVALADGNEGFVLYGSFGSHTGDMEVEFNSPSQRLYEKTSESGSTVEFGLGYRTENFLFGGVLGRVSCDECSLSYIGATAAFVFEATDRIKPFIELGLLQSSYEEDGFEELSIDGSGLAIAGGVNFEFDHLFFGVKYRAYLFDMTDEISAGSAKLEAKIDNAKTFLVSIGYRF